MSIFLILYVYSFIKKSKPKEILHFQIYLTVIYNNMFVSVSATFFVQ